MIAKLDMKTRISLALTCVSLSLTIILLLQTFQPKVHMVKAQELYDTVNATMKAVRASDFESAYRQVATTSQEKYTPSQYQQLFQVHYQSLVEAQTVEFGGTRVRGRTAMVEVYAVAQRGEVKHYRFMLIHEKQEWRVKEVVEVRAWPPGHRLSGLRA